MMNLIRLYTLLLLNKKPMHGYELIKELGRHTNKIISASHVYPLLKLLHKNKMVIVKATGKREKKQYALTKKGKKFADEMIGQFSTMVKAYLEKKVEKCEHCDCKMYEGSYQEMIQGQELHFCCVHCAHSFKKHNSKH